MRGLVVSGMHFAGCSVHPSLPAATEYAVEVGSAGLYSELITSHSSASPQDRRTGPMGHRADVLRPTGPGLAHRGRTLCLAAMSTHVPSHTTAIRALVARGGREEAAQPGFTLSLGSSVRLGVGQGVVALFSRLTPSLRAQAFCRALSKAVPASPCRFWTISQPNHRSLIYRHQPPGCVSTAIVACRTTGGGASAQLSRLGLGISLLVQKSSGAARCLMTFAHRTRSSSLKL
jgi:hypothetical protein